MKVKEINKNKLVFIIKIKYLIFIKELVLKRELIIIFIINFNSKLILFNLT